MTLKGSGFFVKEVTFFSHVFHGLMIQIRNRKAFTTNSRHRLRRYPNITKGEEITMVFEANEVSIYEDENGVLSLSFLQNHDHDNYVLFNMLMN